MKLSRLRTRSLAVMLVTAATMSACGSGSEPDTAGPLTIADQGSFTVGGTTTTAPGQFDPLQPLKPEGQTYHGDHAYTFYQVPKDARRLPLVLVHGAGQFSKT